MTNRTRNSPDYTTQGTFKRIGGSIAGGGTKLIGKDNCSDTTGVGDCQPFSVDHWHTTGGMIHGPGPNRYFDRYYADGIWEPNFDHLGVTGLPSNGDIALQCAARSNPSRPYVDCVVEGLQLFELTHLLRDAGRRFFLKKGEFRHTTNSLARRNIEWQFGIAPLLEDLKKLLKAHEQVDRRVRDIQKLAGPKGLRKTYRDWDASAVGTKNVTMQSDTVVFNCLFGGATKVTKSCHIRWKALPGNLAKLTSPSQIRALAQKAVYGNTIDSLTAWELLPWSWFLDWGFNVSAYLKANRNIVPAQMVGCWITTTTETVWTCGEARASWQTTAMSAFKSHKKNTIRQPVIVSPTAQFPLLDGNQMGILASLATIKAR